tara:strand:- start:1031 stop:1711 length:681 start_codon:yes stop_codon:yes gene_type:complete
MGYLDNSSITVDAILTKRGRELLSRNDGSFRITQFALGDDEIDYTLFNENHPNGTQYASEAIENMPLIEAIPDGSNMMKSQLITLSRGKSFLPYISVSGITNDTYTLILNDPSAPAIAPSTFNISDLTTAAGIETGGYKFTVINFNYLDAMVSDISTGTPNELDTYGGNEAIAETVIGNTLTLTPTSNTALFPTGTTEITTTLIIEGMQTGARKTIQIVIKKTASS